MIERWLGELPVADFLRGVYLRRPLCVRGGAASLGELGGWPLLDAVLAAPDPVDVLIARDGESVDAPRPADGAAARSLVAGGATVVVRGAERHHAGLRALAAEVARDLGATVSAQLYATAGGHHGFGWHYDVEQVFVLHAVGAKTYRVRANTVNPHPLLETMPRGATHLEQEIAPMESFTLAPGDFLYIPDGYWHRADALDDSFTVTLGALQPTALDVIDRLRAMLLRSPEWRRRIVPAAAFASENDPARFADLETLVADVTRLLGDRACLAALLDGRSRR